MIHEIVRTPAFVFSIHRHLPLTSRMNLKIETGREDDGRWLAEIADLPGVLAYGKSREEAVARTKALALRVLADWLEHGEKVPELLEVFPVAA